MKADITLLDMPIGLPDLGYRACDLAARTMLGSSRSRVFLGVRRPLLAFLNDYAGANAWGKSVGCRVSRQMFAILPKIAEVDAFMSAHAQQRIRESHPEVVYCRLAGGYALPSKTSPAGRATRRDLLLDHGFADIDSWLGTLRKTGAKPDDLLDACACAIAAVDVLNGTGRRLGGEDDIDRRGLKMEIWY
ncbi:putative RNase H-like nuclease [Azospirillum soli]|nr:putative RNase H-like nuclease [Azospirillum soli]